MVIVVKVIAKIKLTHASIRVDHLVGLMYHGGTPTPATPSPTAGDDQPSAKPRRSKKSTRTSEGALEWAVGEGIGKYLSSTDSARSAQVGEIRCLLCGC